MLNKPKIHQNTFIQEAIFSPKNCSSSKSNYIYTFVKEKKYCYQKQIVVTKLKNLNYDKTQNPICDKTQNLKM